MAIDLPRPAPLSDATGAFLAVGVLLAAQWLLALGLVGGPAGLSDDRPVLSGRHPLHLYHATLGADTLREAWRGRCYDPAFQAGCLKTPVFDGGSRPAELALLLQPHRSPVAAYKWGLVVASALAPVVFALAAWGCGSPPQGWVLATLLGMLVWWSELVRILLESGHLDLLGVGSAGLLFVGVLPRYAADPGLRSWGLLALAGVVGWYAQPVIWLGLFPIGFLYYAAVAHRQGLAWHLGQVAAFLLGLGLNLWWLQDWVRFWWLRQTGFDDLSRPSWHTILGAATDYAEIPGPGLVGWAVAILGSVGLLLAWRQGRRVVVGVVVTAALLAVILARLSHTWPALHALSAGRAGTFAVAAFALPAADLLGQLLRRVTPSPLPLLGLAAIAFVAAVSPVTPPEALPAGLSFERQELVRALRHETTAEARILWEDPATLEGDWNWSALLPWHTGRAFLGGLDPEAGVEHAFVSLRAGRLNGRAFAEWNQSERGRFVERYNVGWVVCRTPGSVSWWLTDPTAAVVGKFPDGPDTLTLIALKRPKTYVLSGQATITRADRAKLILSDVVPDADGRVVLSYHHQPGFRASPGPVGIVPDKDVYDPVPFLALKVPGPVSRVVLVWSGR